MDLTNPLVYMFFRYWRKLCEGGIFRSKRNPYVPPTPPNLQGRTKPQARGGASSAGGLPASSGKQFFARDK